MIGDHRTSLALAAANLTSAPALIVRIPLEGEAEIGLLAKTNADQQRLLGWLRQSRVVGAIPEAVEAAIDDLEGAA